MVWAYRVCQRCGHYSYRPAYRNCPGCEQETGEAETMQTINDIDTGTEEGRLLLTAIGRITTLPGYIDNTPDEVLAQLREIAFAIYGGQP